MLSQPGFNLFYNAPLLIMIFADQVGFMPQIDCALAAENMMLAAWSLGPGSCFAGLAPASGEGIWNHEGAWRSLKAQANRRFDLRISG